MIRITLILKKVCYTSLFIFKEIQKLILFIHEFQNIQYNK